MEYKPCDVIGCRESAGWARSEGADPSLEDYLCNACWRRLCAKQSDQATFYVRLNPELVPSFSRPSSHSSSKASVDQVVIV